MSIWPQFYLLEFSTIFFLDPVVLHFPPLFLSRIGNHAKIKQIIPQLQFQIRVESEKV